LMRSAAARSRVARGESEISSARGKRESRRA
jgi:hypothetical protein